MISFNFGLLSKYLFLILSISFLYKSNSAPISVNLNQKLCSFKAGDYSLQWAFEPQSKNVVFVLKQKSEFNNFWTGVGFGDRKKGNIDFIGVFVKNGQIGIADTHIIPDNDGNLIPDPSTNVQSIAFDYHNKTVTAKFARALKSPDDKFDQSLDGCQIFNFAINGGSISRSGIVPDFDEIAEKRICDIDKNCVVDIRQHLKPSTSESPENTDTKAIFSDNTKNVKNRNKDDTTIEDGLASMVMYWVLYSPSLDISTSVQTNKNNKKITKPEFAESVDISGTGDPCSFAGNGYSVNWTYNSETEMVEFSMKHPIRMGKWWSAVGIGDTMADMDIAIMFISSGRPKRIRDYLSKSYGVPDEDKQQDWILSRHRTKSVDEMIELGFSRKLETTDTEKDRSLDGCVLFQFAANAGHYGSGFAVRKHEEWPDLYKACDIKKHCTKKESASREVEESKEDGKEEEISESNDDEIIDEADDESDEEKVVTLKKRTEAKEKIENRRQLESSQTENDDGTSTTNVVIQLSSAAFSTLNPSESEEGTTEASAEGTTMASGEIVKALAGEGTTLASENVVENQMSATTGASDDKTSEGQGTTIASNEVVVEGQTTAPSGEAAEQQSQKTTMASGEENQQAASTVSGDETVEGFKAVNNVATESLNTTAEKGLTPIFDEAAPASEASNNEVASTPITTTSEASATPTTETTETTTFPPNVTQQPVHIIPMVGGELNSTMYIPGRDDLRVAPEGGEMTSPENGQGNGTSAEGDEVTTSVPAFGIHSTVQERPTTTSSGESDSANSDVTDAPKLTGEGTEGAENAGTDVSSTSGTLVRNDSTDLLKLPPVTPPFNSLNSTVSPNLASVESESTNKGELPTSKGSISIDKNEVETITVPSNVSKSVAEAGKALTNFADALNNTAIKVEETTAASESDKTTNIDGSKNVGSKTDEGITTPGTVEIVAETTAENSEGSVTTQEVESAAKDEGDTAESTTLSSDGTIAKGGEATTISDENVTEGGKKGNKGKGKGKGKNGKGKNADPTIASSGTEFGNVDVTVSSDVTTAVPGFNNIEDTTIADDSDLTQKQTNSVESTISEGAATVPVNNQIALNETHVTSVPSVNVAGGVVTTPSSKTIDMSENQAATTIDSDANGSTVAIGTLPEISTLEGIQTTAAGNIATTKSVQLVTGGDSNESGDTTENLLEVLSTTTGRVGNGLRDSAVTEPFSTVATNKVTSSVAGIQEATTQATNESPKPEAFTNPEVEGSGETSSSSSSATSDAAATTPIPGPFDHHKQQLINELGKEAVGNPKEGCGESHEDYSQCTTYFKNYLGRVQIWANENNEKMEDQYGKACTLLSQVQNVTTLCCSIFVETCKGKIEF